MYLFHHQLLNLKLTAAMMLQTRMVWLADSRSLRLGSVGVTPYHRSCLHHHGYQRFPGALVNTSFWWLAIWPLWVASSGSRGALSALSILDVIAVDVFGVYITRMVWWAMYSWFQTIFLQNFFFKPGMICRTHLWVNEKLGLSTFYTLGSTITGLDLSTEVQG